MREGLLGISRFDSGISHNIVASREGAEFQAALFCGECGWNYIGKPSGERVRLPPVWEYASAFFMQGVSSNFVAAPLFVVKKSF